MDPCIKHIPQQLQYLPTHLHRQGAFLIIKSHLLSSLHFVTHAFFTRHGGISTAPFDSLNVAYSVGDDLQNVSCNIRIISRYLGVGRMYWCHQVHGDTVIFIDTVEGHSIVEADVMITDVPGVGLMLKTGDCQAVLIADPVKRVIAAVHCGWRGSVINVLGKVVEIMSIKYGCNPSNLIAAIGPSLGPCCAEFIYYRRELPYSFWQFQKQPNYFDFWSISHSQLVEAGVNKEHIEIAGWCTKCHPELFFSYRRKKQSGRMATVIAIRQ